MDSSLIYTDTYTITLLSTDDDGREYECEVVINASPVVTANNNVALNVMGEYNFHATFVMVFSCTVPTPTVTLSPSGPIQGAMVGSPQIIQCTVSTVGGVESTSVMISWMGLGGVIMTSDRVPISQTTSSGNTYTSSLQFSYLMEGDDGMYTCNVMILDTSESTSVILETLTGKKSK